MCLRSKEQFSFFVKVKQASPSTPLQIFCPVSRNQSRSHGTGAHPTIPKTFQTEEKATEALFFPNAHFFFTFCRIRSLPQAKMITTMPQILLDAIYLKYYCVREYTRRRSKRSQEEQIWPAVHHDSLCSL